MSNPFENLLEKYFERLMAKEKEKMEDSKISDELLMSSTSPRKSRDSRKMSLPFSPVEKIRNIIELKKQVSEFETNFKFAVRMCDQLSEEKERKGTRLDRDLEQLEDTERMRESLNMDIEEIENEIYSLRSKINQLEMSEKEIEVLKRGYQRLTEINRSLRTKNEFLEEEVETLNKKIKKNQTLKTLLKRKKSRIDVYSLEKEKLDRENRISRRLQQSSSKLSGRVRELRRRRFRTRKKGSSINKATKRRIVAVKMSGKKGRTRIRIRSPNRKKSGMNLHKYAIMKNLQKQGSVNFFTLMNDVTTDLRGLKCALINVKTGTSTRLLEFAEELRELSSTLPIIQDKGGRVFFFGGVDYFEIQKIALQRLGVLGNHEEGMTSIHEVSILPNNNNNNNNNNENRNMEEKNKRKKMLRKRNLSNTCMFSKDFEGYVMFKDRSRMRKRSYLFTNIVSSSSSSSSSKSSSSFSTDRYLEQKNSKTFKVVFLVLSGLNYSLSFYESEEKQKLIRRNSLEGLKIQRVNDRLFRIGDEMGNFGMIQSIDSEYWIEHMLFLGRIDGLGF